MNRVILAYAGANVLFLIGGVLLLVAALLFQARIDSPPTLDNAADILLLNMLPFKGLSLSYSLFITNIGVEL
jgi:hypothetical protein